MSYTLHKRDFSEQIVGDRVAWAVTLFVTSSDEVAFPSKVFVFQAETPSDPETRGWFTAVATPAQLLEYPEDAPAAAVPGELMQPYYRLDTVQLVSRNAMSLEDVTQQVLEELQVLHRNLNAIVEFTDETEVGTTHD